MKDIPVLLFLLSLSTTTVCSKPYNADAYGKCLNSTIEYVPEESDLCCKKCPPGHRVLKPCSPDDETVCERCQEDRYMEDWNFASNCRICNKCKAKKGLQFAWQCSSTKNSKCLCLPGMYCLIGFEDPYCSDCRKYTACKVGYGVSVQGTLDKDVKCEQCPTGTFSNTVSYIDPCKPHTNCNGRAILNKGDNKSDNICEASATEPKAETSVASTTTVTTTMATVSNSMMSLNGERISIQSVRPSVLMTAPTYSIKNEPTTTTSDGVLAAAIAGVTGGVLLLIIFILLLCLCKGTRGKDAARLNKDENGNCKSGDKIGPIYLGESQLTSFTVTSPEQVSLLEKGEAISDQSQCSNYSETLTRTEGYSSHESISPLQSTLALNNLTSGLSEPMTLQTDTESVTPVSIPPQSSSQPTSPVIISPVTNNPHVNVNITLHINGNGSYGSPSFMPTDLKQEGELPFGEEDESFSTPQQEAGKQSLMSVQESTTYSEEDSSI
ncbi:tumor necrosis factor receptor superfamily member 1B [Cololabis saira]|uniref:tumor necrosis factor receptor superfamily member 1B n=1 Tax=Cololabis saira TaxID=129043 RepID=UPI002AD304F4|nr:tumor necrosis factor receptor superfamily member 1B [Cololabis saira]